MDISCAVLFTAQITAVVYCYLTLWTIAPGSVHGDSQARAAAGRLLCHSFGGSSQVGSNPGLQLQVDSSVITSS